ncbi:hypothetical protein [Bradyrhizobium sp. LMTR 3]
MIKDLKLKGSFYARHRDQKYSSHRRSR